MLALQINQYGQPLALNAVAQPVPTGGEALVRVTACGMCHSDLHIHAGGFNLGGGQTQPIAGSHALPHTLGHEIEGVLEATGPDAILPAGIAIGSRVAVYPWIGCGACAVCAQGSASEVAGAGVDQAKKDFSKLHFNPSKRGGRLHQHPG